MKKYDLEYGLQCGLRCGLIGKKLGHSFSKIIHERLTNGYTYDLFPVEKAEFENFIKQKNFHGLNVTIPYKIAVIPHLEKIDNKALAIGAVNTILNKDNKLYGYNTDYWGFLYLLKQHNISVARKKVIVVGNGGASKAVLAVLKQENAKEVLILYHKNASSNNNDIKIIGYEECLSQHKDSQIIINTSPVGMFPNTSVSPLDLSDFCSLEAVVDVIYNPLSTNFIVQGKNRSITAVGGLEMLIAQAQEAAGIFLGKPISEQEIDRIYREMLFEQLNIVLIGMPSSGKTAIGEQIGKTLERKFIDSDNEIVNKIGMPISEYFDKFGESSFREVESSVINELSVNTGVVISTGGGCVLDSQNMNYLKQNGIIIFINRDIEKLIIGSDRPLSNSIEALNRMLDKRLPLYILHSHSIVENNNSIETAVLSALEAFKTAISEY